MLEAVRQAPSSEELERLLALLESLAVDPTAVAVLPPELRRRIVVASGRISRPDRDELRRSARGMRKLRRFDMKLQDQEARAATGIREARVDPVFTAPPEVPGDGTPRLGPELKTARACYVCKTEFRRQHFFYDAMCPECGEFNYVKRFQTASLEGRVALVTGARVKIGFQTALKLLRAGARVIATTRFPHDAAQRYAKEPDFQDWKDRLRVYGIDLRHSPSVEVLCRHLLAVEKRLDVLVNNACQTVRRPPGWHAHLLDRELAPLSALPAPEAELLSGWEQAKASLSGPVHGPAQDPAAPAQFGLTSWHGGGPGLGLRESARLSLIPYDYDDASLGREVFPAGALDAEVKGLRKHLDRERRRNHLAYDALLKENADNQKACEALVTEANNNGGPDNVTVVIVAIKKKTLKETVSDMLKKSYAKNPAKI